MKSVRTALSHRNDSYWELLATAAGNAESVRRTETSLSAKALTQGGGGPATAPSIVSDRVEALAAFDPGRLSKLAEEWKTPKQIDDDPWWGAAWRTALRHLKAEGAIGLDQVSCPALSSETALLWGEPPEREISWYAFAKKLKSTPVRYELCRSAARSRIAEESLSARDLDDVPWQMLRLLRGRTQLLDPTAIALLIDGALSWTKHGPLEMALVAEICADVSQATYTRMGEELVSIIHSSSEPRDLIPLAYVLLGEWRPP